MSVLSKTIGSPSIEMIFVGLIKAVLILLEVDSFLNLFLGLSGFSCLILQDGIMRSSVLLKEDTVEDKKC